MEILGLQLQKLLVRLSDKGFNLKWNNNEIISWYSAEGAKLKSKSKSAIKRETCLVLLSFTFVFRLVSFLKGEIGFLVQEKVKHTMIIPVYSFC